MGALVRRYGGAYLQRYPAGPGLTRTLRALAACRTAALGGHVSRCDHCGEVTYHYHSCGNRHCPQCGGTKRATWLAQRSAELLPVPYFHVVFTLPHQLSALALGQRQLLYGLLFDAAAATLLEVAADPRHLGARLGVLMVLHTWGQQLQHHPHVHAVVPGGGLACSSGGVAAGAPVWVASRPNFLLPVKVLGRVFRGKYLAGLRQAYQRGDLRFAGSTADLAAPAAWSALLRQLYETDWVVYAKEPFGGPEPMLKYLTRYTHRVAIGNGRLVRLAEDRVTFTWKDYADACQVKELTVEAVEFVRRFALHILPPGFVRIRHYGLLAHRGRHERLAQCRELLAATAPPAERPGVAAAGAAAEGAESPALAQRWSPEDRWRLPLRLAALLLVLAEAAALPPAVAAAGVAWVVTPLATPEWFCRTCGLGRLETIWRADRPTGPELESTCPWDSS